jgi:hypothetical protein
VYGFAITTANTIQTENQVSIHSMDWDCFVFYRRTIEKLSHKSSENWYCSFISIFARNSVSTKRLSPKNKDCLGHRSKIKYRIRLFNIENRVLIKILKRRFDYAHYHEIIHYSSRN